jgi:hypothetical protein
MIKSLNFEVEIGPSGGRAIISDKRITEHNQGNLDMAEWLIAE